MKGRLRRWQLPDTIRRRYAMKVGLVLLFLAATIGTIGVAATAEVRSDLGANVEDEYADRAAREANSLATWHRGNRRMIRSMAMASDLRHDDRAAVQAYLYRQRSEQIGTIHEIHYVDLTERRVVASTADRLEGNSLSAVDRPWANVSTVEHGSVATTTPFRSPDGVSALAYVTGIDDDGPNEHALVVTVRTAAYAQRFDTDATTHTVVVDERGRIVFSPGYTRHSQYDDKRVAAAVANARDDGTAVPGTMRVPATEPVRNSMYLDEGQAVLVGYDRVEDTNWVVLVHAPAGPVAGTGKWVTVVGLGATAGTIVLVTGVGIWMGRDIVRSIDRLSAKAAELESGNFDVDISTDPGNPLGGLSETFAAMASALEERERTLRSQTDVLQLERNRLVALFDNAPDPVARLVIDGTEPVLKSANGRFDRTFGSDADTPVCGPIDDIVEVPAGDRALSSIVAAANGTGMQREIRARTGTGTREFLFRWIPIADDHGTEGYAVFTDITDRIDRNRELKRYETIIEALGDPAYTMDSEGRITFVNRAARDLFGDGETDLVGRPISTAMAPIDNERARDLVAEMRAGDGSTTGTVEYEITTEDGTRMPVENHIAILEANGEFQGTAGVVRDISHRQEREEQLRRSEERYRTLVENSPAPICILSQETELVYCNRAGMEFVAADSEAGLLGTNALSFVHPDDRESTKQRIERVREERIVAEPREQRFRALDGTERVAMVTAAPITYEDAPAVMVVLNDVTERTQYERALRSLNDAARRLLNTESEAKIAEVVDDAAETAIDVEGCAVYLLDSETNQLDPVGITPGFAAITGESPAISVGDDESAIWRAFLGGERISVAADSPQTGQLPGDANAGELLPLGDHGVFVAVTDRTDLDGDTARLIELLAATTEAALDRLASEKSLRDRETLLAQQNERLERQVGINRTIRDVLKNLTGASTREEVEQGACEGLTDLKGFRFAWIGELDPTEQRLTPRVWAGDGQGYLNEVTVGESHPSEPTWQTAMSGETTLVTTVVENVHRDAWRKAAIDHRFNSVISVPLTYQDYTYGVLSIYAEEPDTFGSLERAVFEELADNIADAINTVETTQALYGNRALELTFVVDSTDSLLGRIARETSGQVKFDGIASSQADTTKLFFSVTGTDSDHVAEILEDVVSVAACREIRETGDGVVFEATVDGSPVVSTLVGHGGRLQSAVAGDGSAEYVVDLPPETDVREFVTMLQGRFSSAELVARRDVERSVGSQEELIEAVLGELTDRQREVLATAYFGGFFEWPRESTGEEVADMLDVSQPTINRHLRLAQQTILSQLVGERTPEPPPVED